MANTAWNIYNYRRPLLKKLKLAGWQIVVITASDEYENKVERTLYDEWLFLKNMKTRGKNPWQDMELWLELRRIMTKAHPDVLLSFTIKPNIFGVMATANQGVCCIPTVTGLGSSFIKGNWVSRLTELLYGRALQLASRVVFHNEDDRLHFIKKGLIIESQGMVINGSGIPTNVFQAESLKVHKPFTFLFLGRVMVHKGAQEFIEAAISLKKKNKDLHFMIAGESPSRESGGLSDETLRRAQQHGVKCMGFVDDTKDILEGADCLVLPSYREGMPRAVLEAMSMSRLVIVSDVPGCRQSIVDNESGFLFELGDSDGLIKAMQSVLDMTEEDQLVIRQNARSRAVELFDEEFISEKYLEIIDECLAGHEG